LLEYLFALFTAAQDSYSNHGWLESLACLNKNSIQDAVVIFIIIIMLSVRCLWAIETLVIIIAIFLFSFSYCCCLVVSSVIIYCYYILVLFKFASLSRTRCLLQRENKQNTVHLAALAECLFTTIYTCLLACFSLLAL
jgi:hypothetical protein